MYKRKSVRKSVLICNFSTKRKFSLAIWTKWLYLLSRQSFPLYMRFLDEVMCLCLSPLKLCTLSHLLQTIVFTLSEIFQCTCTPECQDVQELAKCVVDVLCLSRVHYTLVNALPFLLHTIMQGMQYLWAPVGPLKLWRQETGVYYIYAYIKPAQCCSNLLSLVSIHPKFSKLHFKSSTHFKLSKPVAAHSSHIAEPLSGVVSPPPGKSWLLTSGCLSGPTWLYATPPHLRPIQ